MNKTKLFQFALVILIVSAISAPGLGEEQASTAPTTGAEEPAGKTHWEKVIDSVWMYRDSCNVYAVQGPDGIILINAGTGQWLDHLDELPAKPVALLCTHFFRDHSAGAVKAAAQGIKVYAPYWEQEQFADPIGLFQRRETFIIYENTWDLFSPIEPIPVTGWLKDWDKPKFAGLEFQVLPTPGVTLGAISLLCKIGEKKVAFCGEAIHSYGKLARVAPLQYNYNDLPGAINVVRSSRTLRKAKPDILLPSLGNPMLSDADGSLAALENTMRAFVEHRGGEKWRMGRLDLKPLIKVTEHVWESNVPRAVCYFIVSESGKILAIDYGYIHFLNPKGNFPRNRRPYLHSVDALKEQFGIEGIDTVLVTHFHDDHVSGIPMLQRLYGTKCWAGENFADVLANPMSYNFPCTWWEPIKVEPQPLEKEIQWEEYTFKLYPMSGHTRWSTLITFEADGKKFAVTGDQYFFHDEKDEKGESVLVSNHNHVYRNGTKLKSIYESNHVMLAYRPDYILSGHKLAYKTTPAHFNAMQDYAMEYSRIHHQGMPLERNDVHFDVDSRGGFLVPYRTRVDAAQKLVYKAVVRNPFNKKVDLSLRLVGPSGWTGSAVTVSAEPRAETTAELTITPPAGTKCRRRPIALELTAQNRPFGQITEALVTIGHPRF